MKRVISFLLAMVLMAGLVMTAAPTVHAASEMTVSDSMVEVLKQEEGFASKPYYDYGQYTVGYGTKCPDDMYDEYMENGISEEAAETLLRNYLSYTENTINKKFIDKYGLTLTQGQFDALVSITYNCGSAWIYETTGTLHNAVKNGATGSELIHAFTLWCSAGGKILPGLVRRRLSEANMFLNGQYSRYAPDNYCYVYYNPNGGSVDYKIQGYDANLGTAPAYTPTNGDSVFLGWYTDQVGGTKVTTLTKALSGDTLYAHWGTQGESDSTEDTTSESGITITVTATNVNLRKGPGTNYSIVGRADTGDQFTITETASGSGYYWGNDNGTWICLKYTNYDAVIAEKEKAEQETTEPTEPETTEPETTEPETTEPETTVPETTVPETTEPESTTVTGTVKANGGLAVRKGPGTGYSRIRYLSNGSKVTVSEQTTVGSMTWGKISDGWISMSYVVLDVVASTPETTVPETTAPETTVPETIAPETTVPETTVPETTVPETTVPETTVPETTVPETTAPETTVPETTEPPTTEPPATEPSTSDSVKGTVKADGGLAVRNGAGTNYSVRRYLANGASVTVTEQTTVNGITWGKISDGWICMNYVKLDGQSDVVKMTVTADCLRVRSGPGTNNSIVMCVYYGARVDVYGTQYVGNTLWAKLYAGWVSMDYLK